MSKRDEHRIVHGNKKENKREKAKQEQSVDLKKQPT